MRRSLFLSFDDDDHPAAIDLATRSHVILCAPAQSMELSRDTSHPMTEFSAAAPPRVRIPEVVVISDDDSIPFPPGVQPTSHDVAEDSCGSSESGSEISVDFGELEEPALQHQDTGDSSRSGSESGSELSGDFIDFEEPALRRKDRKVLEQFFPLTVKRLCMARAAPNLGASRFNQLQRVAHGSDQ